MEDGWSSRRGQSETAKARKIRKSRKLKQHQIRARWTFNDPNNMKESCPAAVKTTAAVHSAKVKQEQEPT